MLLLFVVKVVLALASVVEDMGIFMMVRKVSSLTFSPVIGFQSFHTTTPHLFHAGAS